MDHSIFMEKEHVPTTVELQEKLGDKIEWWQHIRKFVFEQYPNGKEEWNFPGKKYGWSFRIKDKKRAIIYLLPRDGHFKVAFVFGQKAYDCIMQLDVNEKIKKDLGEAKKYAEGRGVAIDVDSETVIYDIRKLVEVKLKF